MPLKSIWNIECGWVHSSFYPWLLCSCISQEAILTPSTHSAFFSLRSSKMVSALWQVWALITHKHSPTCSCLLFLSGQAEGRYIKVSQSCVFLSSALFFQQAFRNIMWTKADAIGPFYAFSAALFVTFLHILCTRGCTLHNHATTLALNVRSVLLSLAKADVFSQLQQQKHP